jgi:cytochrome c-type biogenesis protein CcmH
MTVFVIIGALLAAGALLFIVPPLLGRRAGGNVSRDAVNIAVYRDQLRELEADLRAGTLAQDQYDRARGEIEARLLEDVGMAQPPAPTPRQAPAMAAVLGITLPLAALVVYLLVGSPLVLLAPPGGADAEHGLSAQQIQALVNRLAARLRENPEDAEGWVMLGRSYAVLGRYRDAAESYSNASARMPEDAQLLADYADALAMAQGRNLRGEPEKIIGRALAIDPANVKALALAGTAAFDRENYAQAVEYWERIVALAPPDSELAQSVRASIAEARSLGGIAQGAKPAPAAAAGTARVRGIVKLAPEFAAKVGPDDVVFVFARAAEGPRMPLAILRRQVRDLPLQFTLDDTMAMMPAMKLSDHPRVVVGARVSKTANANPQPGDLQGLSAPVGTGDGRVDVIIDTELR